MRKIVVVICFIMSLNIEGRKIFDYDTYRGYEDMCTTWNDQLIVTEGWMQRSDLLPYMVVGNQYWIRVTCNQGSRFEQVYTFCATYTCNMNEVDEEGNVINADYGTLSDGEYVGFYNIAADIPNDVQEELMGTDYFEDFGEIEAGNLLTCIHGTFLFHFEIDDTSIFSIRIEVFDECPVCGDFDCPHSLN